MPTLDPISTFSPSRFGQGIFGSTVFGPDRPTTVTEVKDQPYWARDPNVTTYYIASEDPGGDPVETTIAPNREALFSIEIHEVDGTLIEIVEDWVKLGQLKLTIDEPSTFGFSVKGDSAHIANLARPNTIWLRDRWGFIYGTYKIAKTLRRRNMDEFWFDVKCKDALEQLSREPVIDYDTGANKETTVQTISLTVSELLASQVQSPPVVFGHIDPAIGDKEFSFDAHDTSILGALRALQLLLPKNTRGYFYVDRNHRLNWRTQIGSHRANPITVGTGINAMSVDTDYEDLITRLYFYGRGDDRVSRVKLTDAGEEEEYIESDTVGTYGVVPRVIVDKRFRNPISALNAARRIISEYKEPEVRIVIPRIVDVAKADGARFPNAEDLMIGSLYPVIDTDQGVEANVFVTSLSYELDNPLPVSMTLTNRRRRLSDLLRTLYEQTAQPIDIMDGNRYPKHGRLLDGTEEEDDSPYPNAAFRPGDWKEPDPRPSFWDGDEWIPIGTLGDVAAVSAAIPSPGTDIQRHRGTLDAGANDGIYAREKHRHPGVPYYQAANKAGIDAITGVEANAIAHNTGDNLWFRRNDANDDWLLDQTFFATTKAGLPNLNSAYNAQAIGGVSGGVDEGMYVRIRGAWERLVVHYDTVEPFAPVGSLHTDGDDQVFAKSEAELIGGTPNVWIGITHFGAFIP